METYYETINLQNIRQIKNNRLKNEIIYLSDKQNLSKYISSNDLSFLGSFNNIGSYYNGSNLTDVYLENIYEIYKVRLFSRLLYQYKINFNIFIYKNRYTYKKISISFLIYESYPFTLPEVMINLNNRSINYKELLLSSFPDKEYLHSNCNNKSNNYVDIYLKFGFRNCPCCESIFFNSSNFSPSLTLCSYLWEINKFLILKTNYKKLIYLKKIMIKYLSIEIDLVYHYFIGEIKIF